MSEILLHYPVINHTVVTQRFGENPKNYLQFGRAGHNGIDYGVAVGTEVYAAAVGVVEKVGKDPKGYGNYVLITHEGLGGSQTRPYRREDERNIIALSGDQTYGGDAEVWGESEELFAVRQSWP